MPPKNKKRKRSTSPASTISSEVDASSVISQSNATQVTAASTTEAVNIPFNYSILNRSMSSTNEVEVTSTSASTQEWATTFVSYLKESKYNSEGGHLKTKNLQNIYNLLFSPESRFRNMGKAPAFNEILEYMKENGLITVGENEVVTMI
ncbi:unnamed protein product [Meganyctiphanes norvegica]|uniref:Uncharacterized protein n=1 Tax=Meganyctiphanes norvegica TaxID=48144 RepID=A0AAV2SBA4_MEGNR